VRQAIPAIISVDVEPAGFQTESDRGRSLDGYAALFDFFEWFRESGARRSGKDVSVGWFYRMDPQIEAAFGRADHLASAFPDRTASLSERGDHFGLHTHPVRWSADLSSWVHELTDPVWLQHAFASSFHAFERCFGAPCERHRMGAGLLSQVIVDALAQNGARVDTSLEPVRGWGVDGRNVETGIDSSPMIGLNTDCSAASRRPYRPAPTDFLHRGRDRHALALVPMTTTWIWPGRPMWRTVVGTALKRRERPRARVLNLSTRRDPRDHWDLIARQLRMMRRPYLNVAMRTDLPGTRQFDEGVMLLECLVDHPLMSELQIVDPIDALPSLLGGGPRRAGRRPAAGG
jgi:hypothetical protein